MAIRRARPTASTVIQCDPSAWIGPPVTSDILDIFAEAADGVYAVDMDQRIVFWNSGAERILGHEAEEMHGLPCFEVFEGLSEDKEPLCTSNRASVLQARRGRVAPFHKVLAPAKEGEPRWIGVTHVLLPAAKRELGTLAHIFHDVSEDVEAKRLVTQLRGLLSQKPSTPSPAETAGSVPTKTPSRR